MPSPAPQETLKVSPTLPPSFGSILINTLCTTRLYKPRQVEMARLSVCSRQVLSQDYHRPCLPKFCIYTSIPQTLSFASLASSETNQLSFPPTSFLHPELIPYACTTSVYNCTSVLLWRYTAFKLEMSLQAHY